MDAHEKALKQLEALNAIITEQWEKEVKPRVELRAAADDKQTSAEQLAKRRMTRSIRVKIVKSVTMSHNTVEFFFREEDLAPPTFECLREAQHIFNDVLPIESWESMTPVIEKLHMLRESEKTLEIIQSWVRAFETAHVHLGEYCQLLKDHDDQPTTLRDLFKLPRLSHDHRKFAFQPKLGFRDAIFSLQMPVPLVEMDELKHVALFYLHAFEVKPSTDQPDLAAISDPACIISK